MSMSDPVSDLVTRIRNGQRARLPSVSSPGSRQRVRLLDVLKREGYIRGYTERELGQGKSELMIELKYQEGAPVIRKINRVSKPGCRVYSSVKNLERIYNGLGISIVSTPRGVMSDSEARAANVGGEVLCTVF